MTEWRNGASRGSGESLEDRFNELEQSLDDATRIYEVADDLAPV
jgi:hypothetical protein